VYESSTHTCKDGTPDCPVAGTLGSWLFYVMGIFMASVYLLGPKTAFGQSEANPAFWLKLLLMAKQTGARVSWYDPVTDQIKHRNLRPSDWRIWIRFLMTFLINGVGFHILVHALPIQVAAQSSLTGVVFRAVGMMYLVDLDDTPGYTMTLVEEKPETEVANDTPEEADSENDDSSDGESDEEDIAVLTQQIIDDAKAKLDSLAAGKNGSPNMTGALAAASGIATGVALAGTIAKQKADIPPTLEDGDPGGYIESERTEQILDPTPEAPAETEAETAAVEASDEV